MMVRFRARSGRSSTGEATSNFLSSYTSGVADMVKKLMWEESEVVPK